VENLNNQDNDALWRVLADPADVNYAYSIDVQSLVNEHPQVGIFRALLAANGSPSGIRQAVTYFNPATLYKIINRPGDLRSIQPEQIVSADESLYGDPFPLGISDNFEDHQVRLLAETQYLPVETAEIHDDAIATGTVEPVSQHEDAGYDPFAGIDHIDQNVNADELGVTGDEPTAMVDETQAEPMVTPDAATHAVVETAEPEHAPSEQHFEHTLAEASPVAEEEYFVWPPVIDEEDEVAVAPAVPQHEPVSQYETVAEPSDDKTEYFHQDINDEIYDEIVSIEDINLEQLAYYQNQTPEATPVTASPTAETTSHFVFEPTEMAAQQADDVEEIQPITPTTTDGNEKASEEYFYTVNANHDVSKYYDDKLPYTFMWWLDKTRREHAAIYQPYVYYNVNKPVVATAQRGVPQKNKDDLQHQYVEHIFNLNAIDELERNHPDKITERHNDKKEDQIINRFIQAEPHIKPPGNIRLDNENKAKKSSEDADEFVTETLARIYTEQMLYQKAITTYKKLMLKFPEKSLYFAGQIEQLEKKPN